MSGELTQEYVLEALLYSPDTGQWFWKNRPRHHFRTDRGWKIVNGRNAEMETGLSFARGYKIIVINYRKYLAHRIAFLYMTGEIPQEVDHINHIKTDNRWCNLRATDRVENCRNASLRKNNRSGKCGVWLDKSKPTPKWVAQIKIRGKSIYLGRFSDFNLAVQARRTANETYGFHENHGI